MLRGTAASGLRGKGLRSGSLILEIGEAYTKCGFAGESSPRFILPTEFSFCEKVRQTITHTNSEARTPTQTEDTFTYTQHTRTQRFVTRGVGTMTAHDWNETLFNYLKKLYFT